MTHAAERFESRVERLPFSGCWIWMGAAKNRKWGYGSFFLSGKVESAHRASWLLFRGQISEGLFVCHECDVPACVNPDHLYLGSPTDNMRDMAGRKRDIAGRLIQGRKIAKLTEDNVRAIRASSLSHGKLAKLFGCGRATVQQIKEGRTWKHVK